MGSLRDQLVKTGLADDKRARQLAHDEKARKNKLGRDAIVAEKHAEEEERRSRDAAKREQDRAREAERSRGETAREATARAAQLLRDHLLRDGVKGPRRFTSSRGGGRSPSWSSRRTRRSGSRPAAPRSARFREQRSRSSCWCRPTSPGG